MGSPGQFGIDCGSVELEGLEFDFSGPDGHVEGFGVEVEDITAYRAFEDFEDCFFRHFGAGCFVEYLVVDGMTCSYFLLLMGLYFWKLCGMVMNGLSACSRAVCRLSCGSCHGEFGFKGAVHSSIDTDNIAMERLIIVDSWCLMINEMDEVPCQISDLF